MLNEDMKVICKCGLVHTGPETIIFKRDSVANRVKTFCRRCMRRIYMSKVTSDTSAHRKQFLTPPDRGSSL